MNIIKTDSKHRCNTNIDNIECFSCRNTYNNVKLEKYIYDFMIDSLITVIYFSDVTPSSDWDTHSPKFGFLTSFNNR